jgi:hypothetical protein
VIILESTRVLLRAAFVLHAGIASSATSATRRTRVRVMSTSQTGDWRDCISKVQPQVRTENASGERWDDSPEAFCVSRPQ